jgi:hypothetical protein
VIIFTITFIMKYFLSIVLGLKLGLKEPAKDVEESSLVRNYMKSISNLATNILKPLRDKNGCVLNLKSTQTVAILTALLLASILVGSLISESFTAYAQKAGKPFKPFKKPGDLTGNLAPPIKPKPTLPPDVLGTHSVLKQKMEVFKLKAKPLIPPNIESSQLLTSSQMNFKSLLDYVRPFSSFLLGLMSIRI